MDMEKCGNFIRDIRTQRGFTQDKLAELVDVSTRTINNWENGKSSIKYENAERLAEALGISTLDLYVGQDARGIDMATKISYDKWIKETNKVTLGLEDRSITTLDVAISAFGVSIIAVAFSMWTAFDKTRIAGIVCFLLGILGIVFIRVGRRVVDSMNKKFSERKDKISMS